MLRADDCSRAVLDVLWRGQTSELDPGRSRVFGAPGIEFIHR